MSSRNVHSWYALRRTLPPWRFEENLAEMVRVLPRYRVDEVIIKVDVEEFSHGHVPLDWLRRYQKRLVRIREAMQRLGIVYSLNPWVTHGHGDRGRDARSVMPAAQMIVGHDGSRTRACACSMSPGWRRYMASAWRLYAETKPHVLWVEDDIRTFNHPPARFGCFCPLHLRAFSKRVGRRVSRDALVAALLRKGRPHPWRAVWLDLLGEQMIETASFLAGVVHGVDPEICMGLMSSGHHLHGVEGRRWHAFADALADGGRLYSRAPLGNYSEVSLRGLYASQDSIKGTRHVMPKGVEEQTEVENFTYGRYRNSAVFTFLKVAVSFAYGSRGVTMNLFDHGGSPMEEEPGYGRMLAVRKPFLEALARACQVPGRYRGVQLLHHEKAAYVRQLPAGADYQALSPAGELFMQLEGAGIATTYDHESVVHASGETIDAFEDGQIRTLLRKGLMLDGVAARRLVARGFGRAIGIRCIDPPVPQFELGPWGAEEFHCAAFGGTRRHYLTMTVGGQAEAGLCRFEPTKGAHVVSHLVDAETERKMPFMTAYTNRMGGRVVVSALDQASVDAELYHRPGRTRQLQQLAQWLGHDQLPICAIGDGAWPMVFRKDCDGQIILGLFNLSLDPWTTMAFDLDAAAGRGVKDVQVLGRSGRWRSSPTVTTRRAAGRWQVRCRRTVSHAEPLVLRVRHG